MSLPLLPQEDISSVFLILSIDISTLNLTTRDENLVLNIKKYIKKSGLRGLICLFFMRYRRRTTAAKIYNKELKTVIRVKKANIWTFIELFQRILVKYDLEHERLLNGLEIGERRKKMLKMKTQGEHVEKNF